MNILRWWHKRQYRKWEVLWLQAAGKMELIAEGRDSVLYRIATFDRIRAENMMQHHAGKGGLDHALDAANGEAKQESK